MKKLLLFAVLTSLLYSCSKENLDSDVLIRIQNQTSQTLDKTIIYSETGNINTATVTYGNINMGNSSEYQSHGSMYPAFYYDLNFIGSDAHWTNIPRCPAEFQEGRPLPAGRYTLVVTIDDSGYPVVELVKD